jgi:signal transduction histidine kinase
MAVLHAPSVSFAICGFLAWRRRPRDVLGPLMMLFALFYWANIVESSVTTPALFTLASLVDDWAPFVLVVLIMTFPGSRLSGWPSRIAVWVYALPLIVFQPLIFVYDPRQYGCTKCGPHTNLLLISADKGLIDWKADALKWILAAISALVAVTLVVNFVRSTPVRRRVVSPIYLPAAVWAVSWMLQLLLPRIQGSHFQFGEEAARVLLITVSISAAVIAVTFLYGMHLAHRRRGRVADLLRRLDDRSSLQAVEMALRSALGDRSLELGLATDDGYVRPDLQPLVLPEPSDRDRTSTPLEGPGGARLGMLVHDRAVLLDDRELLDAVAAAARLAVDNERLQRDVRRQLEELRESRSRIVVAGDEARRRIERNLHDGAQQRLVSLLIALRLAELQLGDSGDPEVRATLADMAEQLNGAIDELRDLARGLHPAQLSEKGLAVAVEALAERAAVPVAIKRLPEERLAAEVEAAAYYVVAEALTNAARYAAAEQVHVDIALTDERLLVEVSDDGRGGASTDSGSGLRGLVDRVEAAGGTLELISPPGTGTTLRALIPVKHQPHQPTPHTQTHSRLS